MSSPVNSFPFFAKAYCDLPDKHNRASVEDETQSIQCYYMFPAGNLSLINSDGAYTPSHQEHVFLPLSNQYVSTASFDILESRPEQRRFLVLPNAPASPIAPADSATPSDVPSTELPTNIPNDVPIPGTPDEPEEAPSARTRSTTPFDIPVQSDNSTRANRCPTYATIPSAGTRIEVLCPNHRQTDKKQSNHGSCDQKDIQIINSDRGVSLPIDECRVILDVSDNKRPCVEHLHPSSRDKTWRLSVPKKRHRRLTGLRTVTADRQLPNTVPSELFALAKDVIMEPTLVRLFDELVQSDVRFEGVCATMSNLEKSLVDDTLESFKDVTNVRSFRTTIGTPRQLLQCLSTGHLISVIDPTVLHYMLALQSFTNLENKDYQPALSTLRVDTELCANAFYSIPAS